MKKSFRSCRFNLGLSKSIFVFTVIVFLFCGVVYAQERMISIDIPSQIISKALEIFAEQTNISLIFSTEDVGTIQTRSIKGQYEPKKALASLLEDTGLVFKETGKGIIAIKKLPSPTRPQTSAEPSATVSKNSKQASTTLAQATGQATKTSNGKKSNPKAEEEEGYILEDTVVTATKTGETRLQETPLTITALSHDLLDDGNITSIQDIGQYVPSTVIEYNGPGKTIGYIRGIGSPNVGFGGDQSVGFYLDGVYLDKGYGAWASFFDIERVEVLRGPQGTLYGRNSTGGSLHIITREPSDELEINVDAEIGNDSNQRVDAMISGPIIEEKLKVRASFSDGEHDGYLDNLSGPDHFDEDYTGVRGTVSFTPLDTLDIILRGDYYSSQNRDQRNKLLSDTGMLYGLAAAAGFSRSVILPSDFWTVSLNTPAEQEIRLWGVSAELEYELPYKMFLRSITSYRSSEHSFVQDTDSSPATTFMTSNSQEVNTFTQELQLNGSSERWEWIFGAYYFSSDEDMIASNEYPYIMPGLLRVGINEVEAEAWAGFGNITFAVTDRFSVEGGFRYSDETKEVPLHTAGPNMPFPPFGPTTEAPTKESWDRFTPKFGLNYQPTDNVLLFGIVSNGFKSGMYSSNNPPGEKWVDPEILWDYEIGFKTDWFDNRLRVNGAVFYYKYEDLQVRTLIPGGTQYKNAAEATLSGVELEITARPIPTLTLNCAISYLDSEFDEFLTVDPNRQPFDAAGNSLPNAPEWKVVFGGKYVAEVGDYGFLTVGGSLTWTDDTYFDQFNDPRTTQEDYTLVDAFVRFETADGHWSFEAYGKNLGEEEYLASAIQGFGDVIGILGRPRIFGVQVTYYWY